MKFFLIFLLLSIALFADIGKITSMNGKATITRENSILNAMVGDIIRVSDKVDTYKKSKLHILLNDDTSITLGQNTEYIIDSYDDKKDPHFSMRLTSGLLTTVSGMIGKIAPNKFKLKTKTSLIGIRGTKWKTFVGEKSENSVCLKGEITIKTANKNFNLPAGYMLISKDGVVRKFKTNMKFFNALIHKAQLKQKTKPLLKTKPLRKTIQSKNNSQNNIQIKNSKIDTNVKTQNVKISNDGSANVGNINIEK